MTGKDLFGAIVRWTALIWIMYGVAFCFVLGWRECLVMTVAAAVLFVFADEVVAFAYRKRKLLLPGLGQQSDEGPRQ